MAAHMAAIVGTLASNRPTPRSGTIKIWEKARSTQLWLEQSIHRKTGLERMFLALGDMGTGRPIEASVRRVRVMSIGFLLPDREADD